MTTISSIAIFGQMIGEPARAAMLVALMDGRALTAGELARIAGIAPSTASGHLAALADAGLVVRIRQGRHHYVRLASDDVGRVLETVMAAASLTYPAPGRRVATGPADRQLRRLRTCYDHLAGEIAVIMAETMIARGEMMLDGDAAWITPAGTELLSRIGVDLATKAPMNGTRQCKPCLDWTERRFHLGGMVGASLYRTMVAQHWVESRPGTRSLRITGTGKRLLHEYFDIVGEW